MLQLRHKPYAVEKPAELVFDCSCAENGCPIDPACQLHARHGLLTFRPFALKDAFSLGRTWRTPDAALRQVPKDESLKAGPLPDNRDRMAVRELLRRARANGVFLNLVVIKKDEPLRGSSPSSSQMLDLAHRHFDSGERIPRATAEVLDDQVDGYSCCIEQVLQETGVAGL